MNEPNDTFRLNKLFRILFPVITLHTTNPGSAFNPIAAAAGAVIPAVIGIFQSAAANRQARLSEAKARKLERRLEAFEKNRQKVIDQSGAIRALKSQVSNPYANLAVANKASELQIEQTDQALANTLDSINRSGTGAGAATALARMAATSKAQISASIENQEAKNNQLRIQGEATAMQQKMALEQQALGEETAAWGRQEARDLVTLDRLAGLQENAQMEAMAHKAGGQQALAGGLAGSARMFGSFAEAGMFKKS